MRDGGEVEAWCLLRPFTNQACSVGKVLNGQTLDF